VRARAVSFDLGQTLVDFDESLFLAQARQRGLDLNVAHVNAARSDAWNAYNRAKSVGLTGFDAWAAFVRFLVEHSEVRRLASSRPAETNECEEFVRYLWSEQPHNNLWRKPIPGMHELLRTLHERGAQVGVLTNSEGRARELVDELGFGAFIDVVVDSGVEGIEKPDPRIFARLAQRLDCSCAEMVHVGDSYEADVLGALGAGMVPIWFLPELPTTLPPAVRWCRDARELAAALDCF
jgi:HAD superfamily hydrolase (TIGR01549 family)